jgi:hypothetical protein
MWLQGGRYLDRYGMRGLEDICGGGEVEPGLVKIPVTNIY